MSLTTKLNGNQQFQPLPLSSPASFGSFADSGALGSSFGSIGEGGGPSMSMLPGLNGHNSLGAGSPDARWHHMQPMQSAGHTQLGMSPSASGMRPLSLGISPSHQFHVLGSHFPASPGSQHISSPGSQYMASPGIMSCIVHIRVFRRLSFVALVLLATSYVGLNIEPYSIAHVISCHAFSGFHFFSIFSSCVYVFL